MTIRGFASAARDESQDRRFFRLLIPSLRDIRLREPLAPPIAAIWIVSAAAMLSLRPFAASQLPFGESAAVLVFWIVVLGPVGALFKAGLLAAATWAVLALGSAEARFRALLSVFLYGEALMALRGVAGALYLHWTMARQSPDEAPGTTLGLSALAPADNLALVAALQSVSIAHVAWTAFLALALRETLAMSLRRSAAMAAGLWAAVVGAAALRVFLAT